MFTIIVKVAFLAQLFNSNSNSNINIVVAFVAEFNVKIVRDIIVVDVTRVDVIVIAEYGRCNSGDVTTTRREEEEAAGLLLALPSTAKKNEEEMPCVGSPLLSLPLHTKPFSQGHYNVVNNNNGKGGEGGEEDQEVPARGSLLQCQRNVKKETRRAASTHKIEKNSKKEKTQKLNVKIVDSRKEPVVFVGGVVPTPHTHPTPPVVRGWDPPAWGGGR